MQEQRQGRLLKGKLHRTQAPAEGPGSERHKMQAQELLVRRSRETGGQLKLGQSLTKLSLQTSGVPEERLKLLSVLLENQTTLVQKTGAGGGVCDKGWPFGCTEEGVAAPSNAAEAAGWRRQQTRRWARP